MMEATASRWMMGIGAPTKPYGFVRTSVCVRVAVQLLDKALETALLYHGQKVANERKRRLLRRQLEAKKP